MPRVVLSEEAISDLHDIDDYIAADDAAAARRVLEVPVTFGDKA